MALDPEVIQRLRSGDAGAFEAVVRQYFGLVYSIGLAHLHDRELAEDLAQEVFLRLHLCATTVRIPQHCGAWLAAVARNMSTDWLRQSQRRSRLVSMLSIEEAGMSADECRTSASETAENAPLLGADEMHALLRQLPAAEREIIILRYVEEKSVNEIADLMGMHRVSVSRIVSRALATLRQSVERALGEHSPALRPRTAAVSRTVALAAAVSALSATAKARLAAQAETAFSSHATFNAAALSVSNTNLTAVVTSLLSSTAAKIAIPTCALAIAGGGAYLIASSPAVPTHSPASASLPASMTTATAQMAFRGIWKGGIGPADKKLEVYIHLTANGPGITGATMDIPAQKASGLELSNVSATGAEVSFEIMQGQRFEGELIDPSTIRGTWHMGKTTTFADVMKKVDKAPDIDVPTRTSIDLPPAVLDSFVGEYLIGPKAVLKITRQGNQLYTQLPGQPVLPIYAENDTTFFLRVADARLEFGKNADGKIERVSVIQNGRSLPGRKVR